MESGKIPFADAAWSGIITHKNTSQATFEKAASAYMGHNFTSPVAPSPRTMKTILNRSESVEMKKRAINSLQHSRNDGSQAAIREAYVKNPELFDDMHTQFSLVSAYDYASKSYKTRGQTEPMMNLASNLVRQGADKRVLRSMHRAISENPYLSTKTEGQEMMKTLKRVMN